MKNYLLNFFLTLIFFQASASDSLQLIKSIPIEARLMTSDPLGNIYLVLKNNSLLRMNRDGDSSGFFNEIKKGPITQVDASNPLRVLLFFPDYNQIVILNNMLSVKNVLKLNSIGMNSVQCIAGSSDGTLWLYDNVNGSLLKVDEQLSILQNTNLRSIDQNPDHANNLFEEDRWVYLTDTSEGVRQFDPYGFYHTTYHFKSPQFQLFNEYLLYLSLPFLNSYHVKSFTESKLALPHPDQILQFRVERKRLYLLFKDKLEIYELTV